MNESNIEKSKVNNSKVKHIEQGEFETNDKIIGVFNVNADTTKISNSGGDNGAADSNSKDHTHEPPDNTTIVSDLNGEYYFKNNILNIENIMSQEFQNIRDSYKTPEIPDEYDIKEDEEQNIEDTTSYLQCNKTTLTYASDKNKKKFEIPEQDYDENLMYKDTRNQYQVFSDILMKLNQIHSPSYYQFLKDIAQYDVKIPSYSENGLTLLKEDISKLIKDFKKNKLSKSEEESVQICEEQLASLKNNIPAEVEKGGYSVCHCAVTRSCEETCVRDSAECKGKCHLDTPGYTFQCLCLQSDLTTNDLTQDEATSDQSRGAKYASTIAMYFLSELSKLRTKNELTSSEERFIKKCSKLSSKLNKYTRKKIFNLASRYNISTKNQESQREIVEVNNIGVNSTLPYVDVVLGSGPNLTQRSCQAMVDTGCDFSLINVSKVHSLKLNSNQINKECNITLRTAGGQQESPVIGIIHLDVFIKKDDKYFKKNSPFLLAKDSFKLDSGIILGINFLQSTGSKVSLDKNGDKRLITSMYSMNGLEETITVPCRTLDQSHITCQNIEAIPSGCTNLRIDTAALDNGVHHVSITDHDNIQVMQTSCLVDNSPISAMQCLRSSQVWPVQSSASTNIYIASAEKYAEYAVNFTLTKCTPPLCQHQHQNVFNKREDFEEIEPAANEASHQPSHQTEPPNHSSAPIGQTIPIQACTIHNPENSIYNHTNYTDNCPCINIIESQEQTLKYERNKEIQACNLKANIDNTSITPEHEVENKLLDKNDLMLVASDLGKIQLKHLPQSSQEKVRSLTKKYESAFSSGTHPVGKFKYFQATFDIKEASKAKQKRRNVDFRKAPKAQKKIEEMIKNNILQEYQYEPESVANFVLVAKPKAGTTMRMNSKADKMLARKNPDVGLDWRLTVDMTDLNRQIIGAQHVALPKLSDVKEMIRDKIVSAFDVQDGYTSIEVAPQCTKYLNVFYKDTILTFKRLVQGLGIAPNIFVAAMNACFNDDILKEFKATKQWNQEDFPFHSFKDFLLFYIDDCLIATSKAGGEDLHLRALEAVLYAIQRCGLLFAPKKAQVMTSHLQFLGHLFKPGESYSEMAPERAAGILSMRVPRSCGELISRMSFWNWSSEYLPAVKAISLPLHKVAHSGKFRWGKEEAEAFTEVKMLTALRLKNNIFKPELPQFLQIDASKVAGGYAHFQLNHEGKLELVNTNSTILSQAHVRSPSVVREAATLMWAIGDCETHIRACEAPFTILTDCSCLQYIQRTKYHTSRFFEYSIALSQFNNIEVLFIPGHLNVTSDLLSRQFQNVYINNDSSLSEQQSRLIPPMPKSIKKKIASLTNEELTKYILSSPPPEYIDLHDKQKMYTQPGLSKSEVEKILMSCSAEQSLFGFLMGGWQNKELYTMPIIRELVGKHKTLTKTTFQEILKKYKLTQLKEKLESLGVQENFMEKLKKNFTEDQREESYKRLSQMNKQQKMKVTAVTRSQTKNKISSEINDQINVSQPPDMAAILKPEPIVPSKADSNQTRLPRKKSTRQGQCERGCEEAHSKFHDNLVKAFYDNKIIVDTIITSLIQLSACLTPENNDEITRLMSSFQASKCEAEKFQLFTKILPEILKLFTQENICLKNKEDPNLDIYFYVYNIQSQDLDFQIEKSSIKFYLKQNMNFEEYGMRNINLKAFISIKSPIEVIDMTDENIHVEPQFINESGCHLLGLTLMNISNKEQMLSKGTCILNLSFEDTQIKQFCPIQVDKSLIHNKMTFLNNFNNYHSLFQWEIILSKYLQNQSKIYNVNVNKISTEMKQSSAEWMNTLNGMLITKSIVRNKNILKLEDLQRLQLSDEYFAKIIKQCKEKGKYRNFQMENDILYYKRDQTDSDATIYLLCIPANLTQLLLQHFHSINNSHLSVPQMSRLFSTLFFSPNLQSVSQKVLRNCLICSIAEPKRRKKIFGSSRSQDDVNRIGQVWYFDTAYMPQSAHNTFTCLMVFTEMLTSYTVAFPARAVSASEAARTLSAMLVTHQGMKGISCDGGPETRGQFEQVATFNNIVIHSPIPGHSNAQAHVEVAIRYIKEELTKATLSSIPDKRREWPLLLPQILNNLNCQRLSATRLSRRALFYSPVHFNALGYGLNAKLLDDSAEHIHLKCLDKIKRVRETALKKLSNVDKLRPLMPGQIVKQTIGDKEAKTEDGSRGLQSTTKDYFKIMEILSGGMSLKVTSLLTGDIKVVPRSSVERLETTDLLGLELNAKDLFKDLQNARLHTSYKKLNTGLMLEQVPDVRLNQVSGSILKKKRNPECVNYQNEEQYKAILKALQLSESLGIKMSKLQESFRDIPKISSTSNHRKHIPTDPSDEILKRKNHSRKVHFSSDTIVRHIPPENRQSMIWAYSIKATILELKFCCSKIELKLLS